jgi:SAM-dependent methyltransferase
LGSSSSGRSWAVLFAALSLTGAVDDEGRRRPRWNELPAVVQRSLESIDVGGERFAAYLDRVDAETVERLRDGDWDAFVYYALQSRRFTRLPPIEPALSAKAHHDEGRVPADTARRLRELTKQVSKASLRERDERLSYFLGLAARDAKVRANGLEATLLAEYARAMRSLYEKEFVAQGQGARVVAETYRDRAQSLDTEVESGYTVFQALGVVHSLDPAFRVSRALIVGPGLTLASRTGYLDEIPVQCHQPFSLANDVMGLGLAGAQPISVEAVDVHPRVVEWLNDAHTGSRLVTIVLATAMRDQAPTKAASDFRRYFAFWGERIGHDETPHAARPLHARERLWRAVRIDPSTLRRVTAKRLNIITERDPAVTYDAVIATNVLTYFDDQQLLLALANIVSLLRPGGILVHNESRDALVEAASALSLPIVQTRTVHFTEPAAGHEPLHDRVWIHRKAADSAAGD